MRETRFRICLPGLLELPHSMKGDRRGLRTTRYVSFAGLSNSSTSIRRAGIFGALVALLAVVPGVWLGTLWDNSETAYSEVAREVLRAHDAIVMHMNGQPWFIQPPLYFWVAALFAKLLGVGTFAMRLPAVISTIVMGVCMATFTARLAGARAARYASLALSTMLMQVVIGRLAIMDAMLDALVMITILAWARAALNEFDADERGASLIIGSITAALGILTKGPVALAIPVLVLAPWIWLERNSGVLAPPRRMAFVLATIAGLTILLPWFVMFGMRSGASGLGELIMHYTVGRYLGVIENQPGPPYYYLPVFILGVFPWTGICIAAIAGALRARLCVPGSGGLNGALTRLALLWTIVPCIFFSFAQTKLPNYIAPVLPGAALLCGLWLAEKLPERRKSLLVPLLSIPVFTGAVLIAMHEFARKNTLTAELSALWGYAVAFVGCILAGALLSVIFLPRRETTLYAPVALGAGTLAAMAVAACLALPVAERFKPIPPLAAIIRENRQPGDTIALQGVSGSNALMFYTMPPVRILDSPDVPPSSPATDPALVLGSADRVFLVGKTKRPNPDPLYGHRRRVLARSGADTLFLLEKP